MFIVKLWILRMTPQRLVTDATLCNGTTACEGCLRERVDLSLVISAVFQLYSEENHQTGY